MTRSLALVLLMLIAPVDPLPQDLPPLPPSPRLPTLPVGSSSPPAGRHRMTIACGPAAPTSLFEWWNQADSVIRARVNSQRSYDDHRSGLDQPDIMTDLELLLLEVFKQHSHGVGPGATMALTHAGGTLRREDGPETHVTNSFSPPPNGSEWFLFLRWSDETQRYQIMYFEQGAFEVVHGALVRPGRSGVPDGWPRDDEAFADALRRLQFRRR